MLRNALTCSGVFFRMLAYMDLRLHIDPACLV